MCQRFVGFLLVLLWCSGGQVLCLGVGKSVRSMDVGRNYTFDGGGEVKWGGSANSRQGRFFSNPFGILGHATCSTQMPGGGGKVLK